MAESSGEYRTGWNGLLSGNLFNGYEEVPPVFAGIFGTGFIWDGFPDRLSAGLKYAASFYDAGNRGKQCAGMC